MSVDSMQNSVSANSTLEAEACPLCTNPITSPAKLVNGKLICAQCVDNLENDLKNQKLNPKLVLPAFVASLAGALIAAVVWAAIAVFANAEIGYVAVLVGFLSAKAMQLVTKSARGLTLQILAGVSSVIGLIAARFMIFEWLINKELGENGGDINILLSAQAIGFFLNSLTANLDAYDFLWVFLSVSVAWGMLKPSHLTIEEVK